MKTVLLKGIFLLFVVKSLAGCAEEVKTPPYIIIPVIKPNCQIEDETDIYYGTIKSKYESTLSFRVGGKITKRHVKTGDIVKAGDTLIELDTVDISENLKIATARLDEAKSRLNFAKADYARQSSLFEDKIISRAKFDEIQHNLEIALSAYRQAEAVYRQNKNVMEYAILKSPWNATVIKIFAEAEQTISLGQPVITIIKNGFFEIEFYVPDNKIRNFIIGQKVNVTLHGLNADKQLKAVINEISPAADKNTGAFRICAEIINPTDFIKHGIAAKITINSAQISEKCCLVPSSAIYGKNGHQYVWVFSDGMISSKKITVIKYKNDRVKITGIRPDNFIVSSGTHKLYENMHVTNFYIQQERGNK